METPLNMFLIIIQQGIKMALRPAKIYRHFTRRPYTRTAHKQKKAFITGAPGSRITLFEMGNKQGTFEKTLKLKIQKDCIIRSNALEAARIASNSFIKKKVDTGNYYLKIHPYPHHILRYHPLAGVAQADRYYSGMSHAFGKPIGRAARCKKGQEIITVKINQNNVQLAKEALKRASMKFPIASKISIE